MRRPSSVCHRKGGSTVALSMFLYLYFLPFGVYIRSVSWGRRDHKVCSIKFVNIPPSYRYKETALCAFITLLSHFDHDTSTLYCKHLTIVSFLSLEHIRKNKDITIRMSFIFFFCSGHFLDL